MTASGDELGDVDVDGDGDALEAARQRERGYAIALRALARREHSQKELRLKLKKRGITDRLIDQLLTDLQQQGLQSDERFTEIFVRSRLDRGQGELRIRADLRNKGIRDDDAARFFPQEADDWLDRASQVLTRRFENHARALLDAAERQQAAADGEAEDDAEWAGADPRAAASEFSLFDERRKLNARMGRFLASRGFAPAIGRRAIEGLWQTIEADRAF